ncbi:MAG: hypothetical protein IPK19_12960, partial [Chloroflexi bacterium]|nr:hypothetical protein [Chloroflexota bacterium]
RAPGFVQLAPRLRLPSLDFGLGGRFGLFARAVRQAQPVLRRFADP